GHAGAGGGLDSEEGDQEASLAPVERRGMVLQDERPAKGGHGRSGGHSEDGERRSDESYPSGGLQRSGRKRRLGGTALLPLAAIRTVAAVRRSDGRRAGQVGERAARRAGGDTGGGQKPEAKQESDRATHQIMLIHSEESEFQGL